MISDILQDVLAECGIEDSSADIGGTDFQMVQMRAIMNAAGEDIAKRFEWSKMVKTLTVFSGNSTAVMPSDFQEMSEQGAVYIAGVGFARQVVSEAMWQLISASPSTKTHFRVSGGNIDFSPALTANASVRYVSKNWLDGDKSAITQGADDPLFPIHLLKRGTIYRFNRQKNLPYDDQMAEFEADLTTAINADRVTR